MNRHSTEYVPKEKRNYQLISTSSYDTRARTAAPRQGAKDRRPSSQYACMSYAARDTRGFPSSFTFVSSGASQRERHSMLCARGWRVVTFQLGRMAG